MRDYGRGTWGRYKTTLQKLIAMIAYNQEKMIDDTLLALCFYLLSFVSRCCPLYCYKSQWTKVLGIRVWQKDTSMIWSFSSHCVSTASVLFTAAHHHLDLGINSKQLLPYATVAVSSIPSPHPSTYPAKSQYFLRHSDISLQSYTEMSQYKSNNGNQADQSFSYISKASKIQPAWTVLTFFA